MTCGQQKEASSLPGLLHQAVFLMQAAEQRPFHNAVTGWHLVPMVADRNALLEGFRQARN